MRLLRFRAPNSTIATVSAKANAATLEAMRAGADVVFQAALVDGPWFGYADFLVRVDGVSSLLGDYAYEVRDTKLARHPSASALIQMAHYGAMVEQIQQAPPPRLVIWLGTGLCSSGPTGMLFLTCARRRRHFFNSRKTYRDASNSKG